MAAAPDSKALVWTGLGTGVLLLALVVGLQFEGRKERAEQQDLRSLRADTVQRMRVALATAMEAERSAVMAIADESSRKHADDARAAIGLVAEATRRLQDLQARGAAGTEVGLLDRFAAAFETFRRVDAQILDLAVQNSNLKAYKLAFGPAANAVAELDSALAHAAARGGDALRLADDARIAAWRIESALAPHIAEESDAKMTAMETEMATQDSVLQKSLNDLEALDEGALQSDVQAARASYARLGELRTRIIKLSRENTNVRSVALSLNEGEAAATACRDALIALQEAIRREGPQQAPLSNAR